MICMVLVFLGGALAVGSLGLQAKNNSYKVQEEELQAQIKEEQQRSEEIDEFEDWMEQQRDQIQKLAIRQHENNQLRGFLRH